MKCLVLAVVLSLCCMSAGYAETPFHVPEGFELQRLDVTEGRIAKPKGWFYSYGGDSASIVWTMSKEDIRKGPYQSGFRIQFVPAASKAAGMMPEEFAKKFVADKKKQEKVIKDCETRRSGDFMRSCLETVTTLSGFGDMQFHILYSVFWSNEKDTLVFTTFGAPEQEWEKERHNADQMSGFELLGEAFWKKKRDMATGG